MWYLTLCLVCRGPGDLLGSKQHGHQGLFSVSATELLEDVEMVETAREEANKVLVGNNYKIPSAIQEVLVSQGFPKPEDFELQ